MDCLLLHGWGSSNTVWQDFAESLSDFKNISAPCLYDLARSDSEGGYESLVADINKSIKSDTIIIAWSMGGLVATRLASLTKKIKAIVFIASTPCFINKKAWGNVIDKKGFANLKTRLANDTKSALEYFSGLIASGDESVKKTNKIIRNNLANEKNKAILSSWLELMQETDQRYLLQELNIPMQFILGKNDSLINPRLEDEIKALSSYIECNVIPDCGHAPFISKQEETSKIIKKFTNAKFS
ncbi:MAG: alpha/beta fold hydrolase [Proteobacteria bacterium]|nr:alpha/beta fold hydrolase [Pseudomonadota bacterium]NOG60691.1 alpha/beta fold hydrolase [Pseudomonadota bacterium]